MKYLRVEDIEKLEAVKRWKFLHGCVLRLESLSYEKGFTSTREQTLSLAEHAYRVALDYGLESEEEIFALILLWYVEGDDIVRDADITGVLADTSSIGFEKAAFFMQRALQRVREEESG